MMQFSEDHELWLRLKDISVFIQLPEILYFIRLRNSSLSDNHFSENKQITYNLLEDYYKDLPQHFKFTSDSEEERLRGWREYFYGTKNNCRKEWLALKLKFWNCSCFFASLISFLPERIFHLIKKNRMRLRMQFWVSRIKNKNTIQKKFDSLLNSLKG